MLWLCIVEIRLDFPYTNDGLLLGLYYSAWPLLFSPTVRHEQQVSKRQHPGSLRVVKLVARHLDSSQWQSCCYHSWTLSQPANIKLSTVNNTCSLEVNTNDNTHQLALTKATTSHSNHGVVMVPPSVAFR